MTFIMAAGVLAVVLFLLAFLRSGRFGSTILALGAGYILATLWADALGNYEVLSFQPFAWRDIVYAGVVLLPGILALLFGHKQKSRLPAVFGALAVAVFGVALLLPVLGVGDMGYQLYTTLLQYRDTTITVILILGLVDMVLSRSEKAPKHKGH